VQAVGEKLAAPLLPMSADLIESAEFSFCVCPRTSLPECLFSTTFPLLEELFAFVKKKMIFFLAAGCRPPATGWSCRLRF